MAANHTQRPKFYEEQYLGAADLTAAVDYGRIQQARHRVGRAYVGHRRRIGIERNPPGRWVGERASPAGLRMGRVWAAHRRASPL